jgi:C4-dicarboxylate transporter, DctM subunit
MGGIIWIIVVGVVAGITPFLLLDLITIAVLIAFPGIVLFVPSLVA